MKRKENETFEDYKIRRANSNNYKPKSIVLWNKTIVDKNGNAKGVPYVRDIHGDL